MEYDEAGEWQGDQREEPGEVVAVVGDGEVAGGGDDDERPERQDGAPRAALVATG